MFELATPRPTDLEGLERARGGFEVILPWEGGVTLRGWMFLPDVEFDEIRIFINGTYLGDAQKRERDDVGRLYPQFENARRSGFRAALFFDDVEIDEGGEIFAVGYRSKKPIATLETLYDAHCLANLPHPPSHLMSRVVDTESVSAFLLSGIATTGELIKALQRAGKLGAVKRLLDWGCGCGRITAALIRYRGLLGIEEIHGCDIDREAVDWCRENVSGGAFDTISPYPPTSYPDECFDGVISYSVFTHLSQEDQEAWLREMKRILVVGGVFAATIHGEGAAAFQAASGIEKEMLAQGYSSSTLDDKLDGIAPSGYYRGAFQTREHTLRHWGAHFKVVEYVERGIAGYQDLVVMIKE